MKSWYRALWRWEKTSEETEPQSFLSHTVLLCASNWVPGTSNQSQMKEPAGVPGAALAFAEQSVGGLLTALPGSRCKARWDIAAPFFTCQLPPAHAPGIGNFTLFGAGWCQPVASMLPLCCALPWLTDPLLSQPEKPPRPRGILHQKKGGSCVRLHGLTRICQTAQPLCYHMQRTQTAQVWTARGSGG